MLPESTIAVDWFNFCLTCHWAFTMYLGHATSTKFPRLPQLPLSSRCRFTKIPMDASLPASTNQCSIDALIM